MIKISAANLETLFQSAVPRRLLKGDIILKQGKACKTVVFVEEGYLRTFIESEITEINTDFTLEGSFTTNLKSLRSGSPSDTNIQAGEPSLIYEFDRAKLLDLYKYSPEIESFGRILLEKLLIAREEHSNIFKIYKPQERYNYIETHFPELLQRISLSQLASYLGIARETLSRIRKTGHKNIL